jgi:methylated-DNA-[protein]-cysteine S-methyltransferase
MITRSPPARRIAISYYDVIDSPLGQLFIGGSGAGLHRIDFLDDGRDEAGRVALLERESGDAPARDPRAAAPAAEQLREYFASQREHFDVPLAARGTEFQRRVWEALCSIPYGETASYGEIARAIGRPGASRAVGAANGRNPISIVVPCHRVVGAAGALTGYGGGLDRKARLLSLEARALRPALAG